MLIGQLLAAYYKTRMRLTRLSRSFRIPPEARVLDIGAGDSPFAPADVVCEKFPWDDRERTAPFRHDRPLVVGDIEALPFGDQTFDFIFCSHVLEHTFHPDRAIQELMRVGKAGYIEVPSFFLEKTCHSTPSHLWFVRQEQNTLVFSPKPRGVLDPEVDRLFEESLMDRDPLYSAFHYSRFYDLFNISLYWNKTIPFRVENSQSERPSTGDFDKGSTDWRHSSAPVSSKPGARRVSFVKQWVRWRSRRAKPDFTLSQVLACPFCKQFFGSSGQEKVLSCSSCRRAFPVREEVPILLAETAVSVSS